MEWTKEEKALRNSTAESFASLSIGLWTISLIGYLKAGFSWETYFLLVVGCITIFLGLYLILPWNWRQKSVLIHLETKRWLKLIKLAIWLIALAVFALRLIQTDVAWLYVLGIIISIIAFFIYFRGLFRLNKNNMQ